MKPDFPVLLFGEASSEYETSDAITETLCIPASLDRVASFDDVSIQRK